MGSRQTKSAETIWRERLARFAKSNLTVKEFCRRERVSDPSFYQWRKRLQLERSRAKSTGTSGDKNTEVRMPFVPVNISGPTWTEVEFPNGVRVRVPATNAEALRIALIAGTAACGEARSC